MTTNTSTLTTICGTALLIGIIGAIVTLALHGTIEGKDAMITITAIVGIAGGAVSHASGVAAGATAAGSSSPSITVNGTTTTVKEPPAV